MKKSTKPEEKERELVENFAVFLAILSVVLSVFLQPTFYTGITISHGIDDCYSPGIIEVYCDWNDGPFAAEIYDYFAQSKISRVLLAVFLISALILVPILRTRSNEKLILSLTIILFCVFLGFFQALGIFLIRYH